MSEPTPRGSLPAKPKREMRSPLYSSPPKGTPAHQYVASGSNPGCLICGAPPEHPIHDPNELNRERPGAKLDAERRLSHGSPPALDTPRLIDPTASAAGEPVAQRGCMVALFPDAALANQLAVDGGEDAHDLHVTLAFLPDFDLGSPDVHRLLAAVSGFARANQPLAGEVNGDGRFLDSHKGGDAHILNVDVPTLTDFRTRLVRVLTSGGFKVADNHGFSPHMTLSYGDKPEPLVGKVKIEFSELSVASGATRWHFTLGAPTESDGQELSLQNAFLEGDSRLASRFDFEKAVVSVTHSIAASEKASPVDAAKVAAGIDAGVDQAIVLLRSCDNDTLPPYAAQARDVLQGIEPACDVLMNYFGMTDPDDDDAKSEMASDDRVKRWADELGVMAREVPVAELAVDPHLEEKAFVTTYAGKTILTGPASTLRPEWASAASPNPYMRWMQGRLVGAEKPNHNNAMWSTAGLQMGQATVNYGPLNWLHEQRHIIGTLADSRVITRDDAKDQDLDEPFIAAMAAIYAWVCPEEMAVVDMASDSGRLWFSMECVAKTISCAGDTGCGAEFAYMDVMREKSNVCEHLATRSAARLLNEPTFLGAAVIVPPVRPGWANADARVMAEVASMAEFSAENMPKDMTATQWESLMSVVMRYAIGD